MSSTLYEYADTLVYVAVAIALLALLLGFAGFGNLLAGAWFLVSSAAAAFVVYLLYRAVTALERLARAHERLAAAREE